MSNVTLLDSSSSPGTPDVQFFQGDTGGAVGANPVTFTVNLVGDGAQGVSVNGTPGTYTEEITVADATTLQKGVVTLPTQVIGLAYTNVTTAMSPYTVLATDYFLSCDATAGAITIRLPNTTTSKRELIVKDRVGIAGTNPINITTVGGAVTIDGATTVTFTDNYESLEMLFNGTTYETF
jgi:hypothetical protein